MTPFQTSCLCALGATMAMSAAALAAETATTALPQELAAEVAKAQPEARVLMSKTCTLGAESTEAVGLLLRSGTGKNPLSLHLALKSPQGWTLSRLSTSIDYAKGSDPDFLSDWQSEPGQRFEMVCTTLPNTEPGISPANNGAFVPPFSKAASKGMRHLCVSASTVYNSWACFSLAKGSQTPRASFFQLNAD